MDIHSEYIVPDSVILALMIVGGVLALRRPYWGFLLGVFVSVAVDARTLFHSRLSGMGEYFNMADACVAICILSGVADVGARRQALRVPIVPVAILCVVLMGYLNSTISFGYAYEALRALRWSLNLPILYVISANMLVTDERARQLFRCLLLAAVLAEIQHLRLVVLNLDSSGGNEGQLRLIAFLAAHSECWLIAGPFFVNGRARRAWWQGCILVLFLLGNLTHQTRSLAIAAGLSILINFGWLLPGSLRERSGRLLLLVAIFAAALLVVAPSLGFGGFIDAYGDRMTQLQAGGEGTSGRHEAVEVELNDWMDGNPIIGRGLAYFAVSNLGDRFGAEVAWGHVGYVSYLSQLGVIGFFVYALWFPIHSIALAYQVLRQQSRNPEAEHLTKFAGALFVYFVFMAGLSGSYLGTDGLPGILAGFLVAQQARRLAPVAESVSDDLRGESTSC